MGRGRKGLTEQSIRKPKHLNAQRGMSTLVFTKSSEEKKIPVPEHEGYESTTACRFSLSKRRRLVR